jgi:hypothetical protein
MEQIEPGAEGPLVSQLHLCPKCYLVMWSDSAGIHIRQGVPMKNGAASHVDPDWFIGEPKQC